MKLHRVAVVLGALLCASQAAATVNPNYQLLPTSPETYTPLAGGTSLSFSSFVNEITSVPFPSGYDFRWFGVPVASANIDLNGFISFTPQALGSCDPNGPPNFNSCSFPLGLPIDPNNANFAPFDSIYGWWTSIDNSSGGTIKYGMETVNGTDVFTVDWHNVLDGDPFFGGGGTISFKIRLFPLGSKIEVVYGSYVGSAGAFSSGAVLGLQGSATTSPPLYVLGESCAADNSSGLYCLGPGQWPSNTKLTYLWEDKADLFWQDGLITSVAAGATVGSPVTVSVQGTVKNGGTLDAGPSTAELYFSDTPTVDAGSILLGSGPVGQLFVNDTQSVALGGTFTRPPVGKYYLLLVADAHHVVDEIDPGNDTLPLVVYMGVDLTGTISAPSAGDIGTDVAIGVRIFNQGVDSPTQAFKYRVFLSQDGQLDTGDPLMYEGTVSPLSDGGSGLPLVTTLSLPIPLNTPASDVRWLLQVDPPNVADAGPSGAVFEADETNNVVASPNTTHVNLPDLSAVSIEVRSAEAPNPVVTTAYFGLPVQVVARIQNLGEATIRLSEVGLYFSGGLGAPVITGFDQLLADPPIVNLAPHATVDVTTTVTLPRNSLALDAQGHPVPWTEGDFYLGAIADSLGDLGEITESNNIVKVGPIHVRQPAPDFTPSLLVGPATGAPGEVIAVERTLRNVGNQANTGAADAACPYRYYLSSNPLITTEDIPLQVRVGEQTFDEGAVKLGVLHESHAVDLVQLPAGLSAGPYYLGILMDPLHTLDELSTANNALADSKLMTVVESTLSIVTQALPDGVIAAPYRVALGARNVGPDAVWTLLSGVLPDGLHLSADGVLSGTPTKPGSQTLQVSVASGGALARAWLVLRVVEEAGPLAIVSRVLPTAVVQRAYTTQLVAAGGVPPYMWTKVGDFAAGVSLSTAGVVSGTPAANTAAAPVTVTVTVTDALRTRVTGQVTFRVVSPDSLRITTDFLPGGVVGASYPPSGTDNGINTQKGTAPYAFAVIDGALPDGLSLSTNGSRGQLVGKPKVAGQFEFTVQVTDASGQVDSHQYTLTVVPAGVSLTPVPLPTVKPGATYEADLSALLDHATWTLYSGALPPGLTLAPSGQLGGTCDAAALPGTFSFVLQATEASGAAGVVAESIQVVATPRAIPPATGCGCEASASAGASAGWSLLGVLLLASRRRRS